VKTDWAESLVPSRTTGDVPTGGVAADMNKVRAILAELRNYIPNNLADLSGSVAAGLPSAAHTVFLGAPPAGSGLSAVLANGSDERAKVQAALDYVDTTWGSGYVVGPVGATIKVNSPITVPTQVQLRDVKLDCAAQTGTAYAITVNDSDWVPLHNVRLDGPGKNSTVKGLIVAGVGNRFEQVQIRNFGVNLDLSTNNTYINTFVQCAIGESALCVNQDFSTSGANNSGEKTIFRDCTFFNSTKIFHVTNNQGGVFIDGCSLDYSAEMGYFSSSHVFFTNSHIESNFVTTPNGWFFEPAFEARLSFTGCNFMMGSTGGEGLRHIIKRSTGPSVFTKGRVQYSDCAAYFVDSTSNGRQRFSDELQFVEQTATTVVFETPFVSKWGPVSVEVAANDGDIQRPVTASVAIGRDGSTFITGQVTVTVSAAPGTGNYLPVRIKF
jgi:hypothetical protein